MFPMAAYFRWFLFAFVLLITATSGSADTSFDKLFNDKKYKEALEYADGKLAPSDRDVLTWIKMAQANDALGMHEKSLACYMVAWRLNTDSYDALLGVARVYNKLEQPENALEMAKKAIAINFTVDASWEYARACIALGRSAEAKAALEKVLQTDPENEIAIRELGNIYYTEKAWSKAVPLLKKFSNKQPSGEYMFKIGNSYAELGVADTAITYLQKSIALGGSDLPAKRALARALFVQKNYSGTAAQFAALPNDNLNAKDHFDFGFSLEQTGDTVQAAAEFLASVELYGSSTDRDALLAREKLGRVLLRKRSYPEALNNFQIIATADPAAQTIPDVYFLLADAYQGLGNTNRAVSTLEKAIALNSRNFEAYVRLAELYQKQGDGEKAKKTYDVMMGLSPNDPHVYAVLGAYHLKNSRFTEALSYFEKSTTLQNNASANEGVAIAAYRLKRSDRARSAAEAALKQDSTLRDARVVMASLLMDENNFKEAQGHIEKLLKKDGNDVELLTLLATCYQKNNMPDKLLTVDKKIVALSSANVESRLRLARYCQENNNNAAALQYYKELRPLLPKDVVVLANLALLSKKSGDLVAAAKYQEQLVELNPGNATAHGDLGDFYYALKRSDDALSEYRTALKIDPAVKGFFKNYADIVIAKGQQDEVISALSGVVASGDADVGTYTTLGLMYQKKKQYSKAIETYQKALVIEPSNFDALAALASSQASQGDRNAAIVSFEQAMMMKPDAVAEYKELGDLYIATNRIEEAMRAYQKFIDKDGSDATIALRLANYFYQQQKNDEAVRYFKVGAAGATLAEMVIYAHACMAIDSSKLAIPILESIKRSKDFKDAERANVFKMLAGAYDKEKRYADAAAAYGEYLLLPGVRDADAAYRQAFLLESSNRAKAQKTYEDNTKNYPADYRSFLRLGLMYSEIKELLPNAVPLLKRVTQLADSVPSVWLDLAQVYGKIGNVDDELQAYKRYTQTDPQNIEANQRMGMILMKKGSVNEGIVYLEMANALKPNEAPIMSMLASGYVKTGRSQEATTLLMKAKAVKPDDPEIRYALVKLYKENKQPDKALLELDELLAIARTTPNLLLYAELLMQQTKYKDAANALEDVLATDAENVDALLLVAKNQRFRKKYDDAVETYKEISQIAPDEVRALFERAETHMEQSKPQWAEAFYQRALRLDSSMARAELGLAQIAKLKKNTIEYQSHLDKAQQLDPNDSLIIKELHK